MLIRNLLILWFVLLAAPWAAATDRVIVQPVSDWAGVIDTPTRQRLNGYLWELKQKTGTEIAVATVRSTDSVPIEQYSLAMIERSGGLGKKGNDRGCLVLVAVADRQYWIDVGYGLEDILPDGFVGGLGRAYFVPNFKAGQFAKGIEQCVLAIAHRVALNRGVALKGVPQPAASRRGRARGSGFLWLIILFVVAGSVLGKLGRQFPRGSLWYILLLGWLGASGGMGSYRRRTYWGGYSSGGFGSGGFGGGGFGSFGGGGGGFGGGGAGGSW